MTIEEILAGESKNVEFKENLPEKSIKYMKSVVAFANGTGGKIIFGIADKTREVIGFDKEDVFKKMDAIANAVSDSCEPAIIPDITLQTVDGKTIIVVEISEGRQRPYYIKALGRDGGVYVRVAGTTRLADEYMVKELLFEGSNRYYDQALCTGLNITDEDIDALCKAMKEQAVKNAHNEEQKASIKDVGRQQLRSWCVLIERDGKDYPSNAFAILTGNGGLHVATQCGVFKGTTKAVFVDRREYTGPLWEQIEEAFQFVLRNIHLGATIVGVYRQDIYEIPPDAIRELIINAMVHRSYGYLKLLYPNGEFTKEELEEVIQIALEMRRRVKEQLKKLGGMEFYDVNFSYIDLDDMSEHYVSVPEQGGGKLIPDGMCNPGQVYTVSRGKSGMIGVFRLESQMLPGNGKIERTGLGSDSKCKEAVNTAFNYLKANGNRISGSINTSTKDYIINYQDLQGIGMTEKLALPTLIALCSIALGKPVVSNLAILGDITISGTMIKVDELANTLQVCLDSGAKKVLIPSTSFIDFASVPADLMSAFQLIPYQSAEDAVFKALGVE